ncbi:MAG: alpha-glucosidase/alpha-galactosidase [Trueperaceae bacterium]
MTKITFIGAGSTVFAKTLMSDILSYPELAGLQICLFDIDGRRLEHSLALGRRAAERLGVDADIRITTDRERALDGADYAVNMIQVGGYRPATVIDFEIPKRYGLRQTIGDTLGIGGIMRGLRTIPVLLEMQRDMERLCPDVLHLNYVNPMAMNCWALARAGSSVGNRTIQTIGLCHSVPHTAAVLARDIGVPLSDIDYLVAGINHMAFFLRFEKDGVDLYPRIERVPAEGRVPEWNRTRYELFRQFGYFVTESSEHLSEYVPWFIKRDRPELLERFNIPLDEYPGRCQLYEVFWEYLEDELDRPGSQHADDLREDLRTREIEVTSGQVEHMVRDFAALDEPSRSNEYGAAIIHSVETGTPRVIYGNVLNEGIIDNLPPGCCVEVPCLVDGNGVQPTRIGSLPPQLAALMQTNINVQSLTVEAAISGKREHIYHAAMLDPHTAAELTLDEIRDMVDDLLEAHAQWLPEEWAHRPSRCQPVLGWRR